MRSIAVVLVSYNSRDVILQALSPLADEKDLEIIVVDNASADSTVRDITAMFSHIRIIRLDENVGFAKAVNIGIKSCRSENILLLNPDAIIEADVVRVLASHISPASGVIAPLISEPGERLKIISAGHFPTIRRMFLHFFGLSRFSRSRVKWQGHYLLSRNISDETMEVDWVTGAVMLFPKEVWQRAGRFSERWFMYAEDIDFCHRVKALGLRNLLVPSARATHLVGKSDSTASFKANPAWILNLHDFYKSEISGSQIHSLAWCGVVGLGLLSRALVFACKGIVGGRNSHWAVEAKRFRIFSAAVMERGLSSVRS